MNKKRPQKVKRARPAIAGRF